MKKIIILFLLIYSSISCGFTQLELPRLSPNAVVSQRIGLTEVTITYCRPKVKERKIWGNLVPYDQVWRAGANEATTIYFEDPVTINDDFSLDSGTYTFYVIPVKKGDWTIIFNTQKDIWGTEKYNDKYDILEIKTKPEKHPHTESLQYGFDDIFPYQGKLELRWERKKVGFIISVDDVKKTLQEIDIAIKNIKKDDWKTYTRSAEYCAQKNVILDKAEKWADKALDIAPNEYYSNWVKADILSRKKEYSKAISYAESAKRYGLMNEGSKFRFSKKLDDLINIWKSLEKDDEK